MNNITRSAATLAVAFAISTAMTGVCFAGKPQKWEKVPEAVRKTILANGGTEKTPVDLEGMKIDGKAVYEAEVKEKDGTIADLVITSDGKLVEIKRDSEVDKAAEEAAKAKKNRDLASAHAGQSAGGKSSPFAQPSLEQLAAAGLGKFPLAPESARVDLAQPVFDESSTKITNPLFPISHLRSAILNGKADGAVFRVETTLLPQTRVLALADGKIVKVLVSQYTAYHDNRIEEVAIDLYAQDTAGAVWYLGEDVFNYVEGAIVDRSGTWHAGIDGPAALIMPARPKVGDVFRPENVPGFVFEEVTVKEIDKEVTGPRGAVKGAIVARELHDDGTTEEKIFAPGYGEFYTGSENEVEALALAVPTDAIAGSVPAELAQLEAGAGGIYDAAIAGELKGARAVFEKLSAGWSRHAAKGNVPPRLKDATGVAMKALDKATSGDDRAAILQASLDVLLAALDMELQFRPPTEIDIARFDHWLRRCIADALANDHPGMMSDMAIIEWVRDRFVHECDKVAVTRLDHLVKRLRDSVKDRKFESSAKTAQILREHVKAEIAKK